MSYHDETTEYPRPGVPTDGTAPGRRTGRHPVNTGHLVMGVAFVGLVIVWALVKSDTVEPERAGWIMGLPWLAAGAAGLIASVLRGRRRDDDADQYGWDGHQMRGWQ
ncbi:hypothetical protein KVF89_17525 [Nocardioides carbamazepini]|jgi:hypothetical protein|uniref:hypothetical protein n=1 Tax=Nocardioides carbamazepini TaxID=2854259 RepID=UPI00214A255D|nr:hypothetical protein [Nocardioides carbamazepini]MCR1784346.1 hypothetical protein [Nocardioides carbamazepini]